MCFRRALARYMAASATRSTSSALAYDRLFTAATHAGRNSDAPAIDQKRHGKFVLYPLRHQRGIVLHSYFAEQHGEFIPAHAGEQVVLGGSRRAAELHAARKRIILAETASEAA